MKTILLESGSNPDSASIQQKNQIDISVLREDLDALEPIRITTNYTGDNLKIVIPNFDSRNTSPSMYYTPIYKERLNYEVWLNRINKNFDELD